MTGPVTDALGTPAVAANTAATTATNAVSDGTAGTAGTAVKDDIALVGLNGLGAQRAGQIRALVKDIPDYPKAGIIFRDITPMLADGPALHDVIEAFARACEGPGGHEVDVVAGMEARGFLLGAPLAVRLGVGFVPLRKQGKLPPPVERVDYELEYGHAAIELRHGTLHPGARVLLVDDVLATGGTALAAAELVERSGGVVAALTFLMELGGLGGREKLAGRTVETLLRVEESA